MSELLPLFTYSPDGILTARRVVDQEDRSYIDKRMDELDHTDHFSVSENEGVVTVEVPMSDVLPKPKNIIPSDHSIASKLIHDLRGFGSLTFDEHDDTDGVMSVDIWDNEGFQSSVYWRMQQWLNEGGMTDEVIGEAKLAMARPMGKEAIKSLLKSNKKKQQYDPYTISLRTKQNDFYSDVFNEETGSYEQVVASWNHIDAATIGSCACIGHAVNNVHRFHMLGENKHLYNLSTHNVNYAPQSLSLALGMGTLAYHAAQYTPKNPLL